MTGISADGGAMVQIRAFLFDDVNEAKLAAHGIRPEQLDQLLDEEFVAFPNRKERRGLYLVIGRDWGGMCIAAPVEATHDRYLWRPITAWPCKDSEATRLDRAMR